MTKQFTELQVKQMNGAIKVLGEAITRIIELQGYSDLTLSLEGSVHDLDAILKEFDGSQVKNEDVLNVALNADVIKQVQKYTNEQITDVFTDLGKIYERKVDELSQMYKDGREEELDYATLEQETDELRNVLATSQSNATLVYKNMLLQELLNSTTSGSIYDAISKFVVKEVN
ncbi:hypothetical protein ABD91_20685 [Lysinibacillus sphaericus]|uniref:hypothetical protein n=1 Tax=Lysinibacillus sphaericus TaxID=1421 RepID=UPI0018CDF042|nr:hypothetical protein [Lysinibacillus sphaericus]MBG9693160.1 hypothetical protein [Lysinibacillus sphaericus]